MTHQSRFFPTLLTALILVLTVTAIAAAGASAQEPGILEGQIVNGSTPGVFPADLPVTLLIFKDMSMDGTAETTSDEEGRFRFEGLDTSEEVFYQVAAEYQGLSYLTDFLQFQEGEIAPVTLSVYEETTSDEYISVERLHVIVKVSPRKLQIGQLYVFSNSGDRTYVGDVEGTGEVLRFSVPEGATNFELQDGELGKRFIQTADGFADTSPVVPGTGSQQVLLSYDLEFDSPQFDFSVTTPYSTAGVNVLVSDVEVEAESPVLETEGLRTMQGQNWVSLAGKDLPEGQAVSLSFSNLPLEARQAPPTPPLSTPTPPAERNMLQFVLLGLILFGLGVLVGYNLPHGKDKGSTQPGTEARSGAPSPVTDTDDLIVALADLDDAYERGEIPDDDYRTQRADLKQGIADQLRREGK